MNHILKRNWAVNLIRNLVLLFFILGLNYTVNAQGAYQGFILNDSISQYFFKPAKYKANNKEELLVDFTVRSNMTEDSLVVMNFTYKTKKKVDELKSLTLITSNTTGEITKNIKELYNEKEKKYYIYRYTSLISYGSLPNFFEEGKLQLDREEKIIFSPIKKTKKWNSSFNFILNNF